jgi:DNA processing protein
MDYRILLAHYPKITYLRYKKLTSYFSDISKVWEAEIIDLIKAGLDEAIAHEFLTWRESTDHEKILQTLEREQITTVSLGEKNYPELLSQVSDPPHTLFIRGSLPTHDLPSIAIVGTRHHTTYGKQVTEELSFKLAQQGLGIMSGLALGIDGIAHEAALKAQGITVAVLGSGIDRTTVYPASHQNLAERIIFQGGAIVSEYPPGFRPTTYSFPARNRIVAGLTLGTLITEAPEESGALITARCALDYNREVMAVPHPITSETGEGGNKLIQRGAALIRSAQDVMEVLNLQNIKQLIDNRSTLPTSPTEAIILQILSKEPVHIDAIIKKTNLTSAIVMSTMTLMEMKGRVKNVGGMMYVVR